MIHVCEAFSRTKRVEMDVRALRWAKRLFILFLFYFIILPHTMNYKPNKNDNK